MKVGIVIICYNIASRIFLLQVEALKKFCKDDFVIEVFDNSFDEELSEGIRYHCSILEIPYTKTNATSKNGSDSHSFAANLSFDFLKDKYDYFAYLDHDLIPLVPFSVVDILGDKILAGVGQGKNVAYIWPGCLFISTEGIDKELIDFSPNHKLGYDTGGGLSKIFEAYGKENCIFFNEIYCQNPGFTGKQGYYSLINNGMFMHFIEGSNWEGSERHEERINSLLNIAQTKIDEAE